MQYSPSSLCKSSVKFRVDLTFHTYRLCNLFRNSIILFRTVLVDQNQDPVQSNFGVFFSELLQSLEPTQNHPEMLNCQMEHDLQDQNSSSSLPRRCISYVAMKALDEMRLSNTLCDATITQDESTFPVHRAILGSCSDYFRTLFTTSLPSEKDHISIGGIRGMIMERIIKYAYLRELDISEEDMFEMYAAADFLGMPSLQERCIQYIKSVLRTENCVRVMLYGQQRHCTALYEFARKYVLKNFLEVSRQCSDLMKVELEDICGLLSDECLNVKDEEPVWECCVRWIDADVTNRIKHIARLLRAVRLGLLKTQYFLEKVKEHPFVLGNDETKPIIIETLTFLYDLDMVNSKHSKVDEIYSFFV